ncbi:MAG: flagellar basal body rod protein FlgB [Halieaceae bacterium]|jgi:flagellar basal-body rod protein FlgB|nr:flagellar basal body rod protein FlgB [Halieaceae bacterium]
MAGIDNALGISPQVLALRTQRMNLLTANIANADTPNYKARDIDFKKAMEEAQAMQAQQRFSGTRSHDKHFEMDGGMGQPDVMYRVPSQLNPNGNTVERHREHSEFMDNALRYQVSLQLLDSRIKGIRNALKGGQA